jgi:hypothetical protein
MKLEISLPCLQEILIGFYPAPVGSVQTLRHHLLKLILILICPSVLIYWTSNSALLFAPAESLREFLAFPMCATYHTHHVFVFCYPNNIQQTIQVIMFLIMQFFPASCQICSLLHGSTYFCTYISNTLNLCFSA